MQDVNGGPKNISIVAMDQQDSVVDDFELTITPINDQLTFPGATVSSNGVNNLSATAIEDEPFSYTIDIDDIDSDNFCYQILDGIYNIDAVEGLDIDSTGTVSWLPPNISIGDTQEHVAWFSIIDLPDSLASQSGNCSDLIIPEYHINGTQYLKLQITETAVNDAPVISQSQEIRAHQQLQKIVHTIAHL